MKTKDQLEAEISPLQAALQRLRNAEQSAEAKALVGKCFKYRNNYGSDCPGWWLYSKVTKAGEYWPICFSFEETSRQMIEVKYEDHYHGTGNWKEITPKEFNAAWKALQRKLAGMKP